MEKKSESAAGKSQSRAQMTSRFNIMRWALAFKCTFESKPVAAVYAVTAKMQIYEVALISIAIAEFRVASI